MSNLENYFENLLFEGLDYEDEINKRHLTPEEIEAVKTCAEYITYTFFNGKDELKKYINGEIDVVKTGKWIPVSERLPDEEKGTYWVCTDTECQCECRWTNVNHIWTELTTNWHWHIMDIPQYTKVIAWMPLPEPYKEANK